MIGSSCSNVVMATGRQASRRTADLHECLSAVLASQHADECLRSILETFGHVLPVAELTVRQPAGEPLFRLCEAMGIFGDQERLHARAEDDQQARVEAALDRPFG